MSILVKARFGTFRGLVRLVLAYVELGAGRLAMFSGQSNKDVRRLVFVCQGNICRSAFGGKLATDLGLPTASLGLSTTSGVPSPPEALASARRQGVDLSGHRAIDWSDFEVLAGDMFLVMEIRQAHEVRRRLNGRRDVSVALLGMWCTPITPHLHDPFTLSDSYFDTCFARIRGAVENMRANFQLLSPLAVK